MATYKLMQDIEAEDHILGPLSLRQFLFALAAVFMFYLCFLSITKHFPFMLTVFLPPALFCLFFAIPFGMDQPTEIWALAKVRFLIKPRVRVWNQSGVKEMVTITAPRKAERIITTDGLSQTEVKSRLRALADTIDSRGWAVKNVNPFMPQPVITSNSDRLLELSSLPQEVPDEDAMPADDVMDANSSPIAQQFDTMITQTAQSRRQGLIDELNDGASKPVPTAINSQPDSQWFMKPSNNPAPAQPPVGDSLPPPVAPLTPPVPSPDEETLARELKERAAAHPTPYSHMRTLQPVGSQPVTPPVNPAPIGPAPTNSTSTMTTPGDPDILALANNNDFSVETLAHEAQRTQSKKQGPPEDEVVISLH